MQVAVTSACSIGAAAAYVGVSAGQILQAMIVGGAAGGSCSILYEILVSESYWVFRKCIAWRFQCDGSVAPDMVQPNTTIIKPLMLHFENDIK